MVLTLVAFLLLFAPPAKGVRTGHITAFHAPVGLMT